jgi:hypothetical protein
MPHENEPPRLWLTRFDSVIGVRDAILHNGQIPIVFAFNLPRSVEFVGRFRSVFESRPESGVCFDVVEASAKNKDKWLPGYAELLGLVETGIDLYHELVYNSKMVAVFASRRGGEAVKIAVAVVSAVVSALAKTKADAHRLLGASRAQKAGHQRIDAFTLKLKKAHGTTPEAIRTMVEAFYYKELV